MGSVPPSRHLQRAKDLVDSRYAEALTVDDLAGAAGLSRAHFSREFRRTFGDTPHAYLLTRRLERAAALLRGTDRNVADICIESEQKDGTETEQKDATETEGAADAATQHAACLTAGIDDTVTPDVQHDDQTAACSLDTGGDNESGDN